MTIALEFKHDIAEWADQMPNAIKAIDRWAEVHGHQMLDQFGVYYQLHIRNEVKVPTNKVFWVIRPATLRLGAQKALQEAGSHWAGWEREISNILYRVSRPQPFEPGSFDERELDFMVQLALFREVWFA